MTDRIVPLLGGHSFVCIPLIYFNFFFYVAFVLFRQTTASEWLPDPAAFLTPLFDPSDRAATAMPTELASSQLLWPAKSRSATQLQETAVRKTLPFLKEILLFHRW